MAKLLPLTKGQFAIVDDADHNWLMQWKWTYNTTTGYAYRNVVINGKKTSIYLHRFIVDAPGDVEVDHINLNRLDFRRCNLRIATSEQNARNRAKPTKQSGYTSQYKGVFWNKYRNKWQANIRFDRKQHWIGLFRDEADAARAYDIAAQTHHGEFAQLNFPIAEKTA